MKPKFALLCLTGCCMSAFASIEKDKEFITAALNASDIVCFDTQKKYRGSCDKLRVNISRLESQYSNALIEYGWDSRLLDEGRELNEHSKKADELEKMRLVLDHKLKELVLIERLKELNIQHSELKDKLGSVPRVYVDINQLMHELSFANKIELRKSTSDTGHAVETIVIYDKSKISMLRTLISELKLNYDPKQGQIIREEVHGVSSTFEYDILPSDKVLVYSLYSASKVAELIVDDRSFVRIYPDTLVFRSKAYTIDNDETDTLELVEAVLGEEKKETGQPSDPNKGVNKGVRVPAKVNR